MMSLFSSRVSIKVFKEYDKVYACVTLYIMKYNKTKLASSVITGNCFLSVGKILAPDFGTDQFFLQLQKNQFLSNILKTS